jgi:hypothetical protein
MQHHADFMTFLYSQRTLQGPNRKKLITATSIYDLNRIFSVPVTVDGVSGTRLLGGAIQGNTLSSAGIVSTLTGSAGMYSGVTTDGTSLFFTNMHSICKADIATGIISTIAGIAEVPGSSDGTGNEASFNYPYDLTTDGTNLYVVDSLNSTIRKIVIASGVVSTFAGTPSVFDSKDGIGTDALFNEPEGITTDGTHLYVADYGNYTIRKIDISTANVTTIAGLAGIAASLDGRGSEARFKSIGGITTDGTNLYVAESGAYIAIGNYVPSGAIRKIVIDTGDVTTLAGSGTETGSADNVGLAARFSQPMGITTDGTNLYVVDRTNYTIRKFEILTGTVTTIAGTVGVQGFDDATGTAATFYYPNGITTDGKDLYVTDGDISTGIIRKIQ